MNRTKLAFSALSLLGFSILSAPATAQEQVNVVASFSIIGDIAREVGGDRIALRTLVGANGDAHVYEPRPADAMALAEADVVLVNGLSLEGFMTRLVEASGSKAPVVALSDGANILADPLGGHYHFQGDAAVFHAAPNDPHAWQSIANVKVYASNAAKAFCKVDPGSCEVFQRNAGAYADRLTALEGEVSTAIAAIPADRRVAVVAHNAFRYLEHDYGIQLLSPQGVSTQAEASAADVASLIRQMREKRAVAVFAENISNKRLVEQIASEAGVELSGTLYSDALSGPDGPASTYVDLMRHNVASLTAAMSD